MLRSDELSELPWFRKELEIMLKGGHKCELESLYSLGLDHLGNELERSLLTGDYI
jgi:DNA topoisomerase VI subunit A